MTEGINLKLKMQHELYVTQSTQAPKGGSTIDTMQLVVHALPYPEVARVYAPTLKNKFKVAILKVSYRKVLAAVHSKTK